MKFIAVDPGGVTGWALFDDDHLLTVGEVSFDQYHSWLEELHPDLFVIEDYKIRPASLEKGWSHQWNDGQALQIIGAIEYHSYRRGIQVVRQQPSIKPLGYAHAGLTYRKDRKGTHINDAVAHGFYFWRKEHGPSAEDAGASSNSDTAGERIRNPTRIAKVDSWKGLRGKRGS